MPRREREYYEERERDYYPSSSSTRGGRVTEYEEIDIERRRGGRDREPDFLRDDYDRRSSAGPLVVREEEIIEERRGPRREHRPRGSDVEEITIARGVKAPKERPVEREIEREEIIYKSRERPRERPVEREVEREEIIYRKQNSPPRIAREREEYVFRPKERRPSVTREEIIIKEKASTPRRREPSNEREEITIRRGDRESGRPWDRGYEREDIVIRRDEVSRERPRERDRGGYERDEITIRREGRSKSRERPRPRDNSYERDEVIIRRDERSRSRVRERDYREEDIIVRRGDRERERPRDNYQEEDIIIRRDEGRRDKKNTSEEIIIRRNEKERTPTPSPSPPPMPEPVIRAPPIHQEIITHHRHIDHGYEVRVPPPAPRPRTPPRSLSPSAKSSYDEVEIRRRGERNGKAYDEDIIIDTRRKGENQPPRRRSVSTHSHRPYRDREEIDIIERRGPRETREEIDIIDRRGPRGAREEIDINISRGGGGARRGREDADINEEAEYYARRNAERSYPGEAYNGATRDWAIVDVPPGTNRVKMDGVGGASQEVTWQRYNGVRRSKFIVDEEVYAPEAETRVEIKERYPAEVDTRIEIKERIEEPRGLDVGRRFVGQKSKKDTMWTEITKDLVTKEAIEGMGYDYEETEFFYYVMEYLRYEDVLRLVEVSEDLRAERRERIREIEWERSHPPPPPMPLERERPRLALAQQPWDEERVIEREIIYDRPPPRREPEVKREIREKIYVTR